jgi:hypothetical protein
MGLYRALITSAISATGEVYVKIPSVLGASESIALHVPTFFNESDIPSVGDQLIVAIEGDNFNKVYLVSNITDSNISSINGGSA